MVASKLENGKVYTSMSGSGEEIVNECVYLYVELLNRLGPTLMATMEASIEKYMEDQDELGKMFRLKNVKRDVMLGKIQL